MSLVQIDDYECPHCNKTGMGELNLYTKSYTCCMCGKREDEED